MYIHFSEIRRRALCGDIVSMDQESTAVLDKVTCPKCADILWPSFGKQLTGLPDGSFRPSNAQEKRNSFDFVTNKVGSGIHPNKFNKTELHSTEEYPEEDLKNICFENKKNEPLPSSCPMSLLNPYLKYLGDKQERYINEWDT